MKKVRKAAVSGTFYPSSATKLESLIQHYLSISTINPNAKTGLGFVIPHAGYLYSGLTAAYAYKQIEDRHFENAIVLSPSHREYFDGISIYDGDAYSTPLGDLEINKEIADLLIEDTEKIFYSSFGHKQEHAIEVHLPFLQTVAKNFTIVPVVMGAQSDKNIEELANKLALLDSEKNIIIASSDLSHFHSKTVANRLDSIVKNHIESFSFDSLNADLKSKKCEACGGGLIVSLMKALQSKKELVTSKILHRSDSGDVSGDNNEVVGYLSAVFN